MEEKQSKKMLSPKIDVVFQSLFGEEKSERITKGFLESILKEKIDEIDLSKNPILRRELRKDKLGVLDVIAKINGKENCNIEMQVVNKKDIVERILYYWSRMYSKQIKRGEEYVQAERTIIILIADFEIERLRELKYHSSYKIIEEEERRVILTEKMEIHIIELPKIRGQEEKEDKLLDWLFFIEDPESRRVKEKMKENEELKEAGKKLKGLSEEERLERIAELREKAILDEKSAYGTGLEEGERKEKLQIAKRLLEKNMPIKEIMEITNLSEEEILKIDK